MENAWRKDITMDYLVVFITMLMIAGYACIIGRSLRETE
jgi:heme/copper-type cytochrome/quinol oxidase subunit 1